MQSVGAPGADSITLLVSPASLVFTLGANDIVNNLASSTAGQRLARTVRAGSAAK